MAQSYQIRNKLEQLFHLSLSEIAEAILELEDDKADLEAQIVELNDEITEMEKAAAEGAE